MPIAPSTSTSSASAARAPASPPASPLASFAGELAGIEAAALGRRCAPVDSPAGPRIRIDGRDYLHLCSNNYLDLASHPEVVEAARGAAARWGAGAGSARLITGSLPPLRELEDDLAEFKGTEGSLLFSSGYMANLGAICGLARRGDTLVCDELNHASLIDAARLSRAEVRVYRHGDAEAAREALARARAESAASARVFVVTDGVFSMDGDVAPLGALSAACLEHAATLVVDDAHGTGAIGPEGRGSCAEAGVRGEHVLHVVTLSKALGSQGGAVCGPRVALDLLVNRARSFIFETAMAPASAAAARAALGVVLRDEARRTRLRGNALALREALEGVPGAGVRRAEGHPDGAGRLRPPVTPIFPVVVGSNEAALGASAELRERGYWVTAIRPPSVPEGEARLRATVMASHDPEDLRDFARAVAEVVGSRDARRPTPAIPFFQESPAS